MTPPHPTSASLRAHIRAVPDFPRPGIVFRDITPLLQNATAFTHAVALLTRAAPANTTHVAAIEARGFLLAPAIAAALQTGVIPIRKAGKLPGPVHSAEYALEYGTDHLAIHQDALTAGDRVYLIDDLIATGGSLAAAATLIHRCGATIPKIACLIELPSLAGRHRLRTPNGAPIPLHTLLAYP